MNHFVGIHVQTPVILCGEYLCVQVVGVLQHGNVDQFVRKGVEFCPAHFDILRRLHQLRNDVIWQQVPGACAKLDQQISTNQPKWHENRSEKWTLDFSSRTGVYVVRCNSSLPAKRVEDITVQSLRVVVALRVRPFLNQQVVHKSRFFNQSSCINEDHSIIFQSKITISAPVLEETPRVSSR